MNIGILMCGHAADEIQKNHGDFDYFFSNLLAGHGFDFGIYDVENMEYPASVLECDGWLLTGSKHGAYEDHAFIPPLEQFVRDARASKVPMVGICFGHQVIARAFGGHVAKYEGGWAVGRHEYQTEDGGDLALSVWHQDQVITPPSDARTTARSGFCAHAALVYPDGIWTMQPHPEFSSPVIKEYLYARGPEAGVPVKLMEAASKETKPIDNVEVGNQIAEHFLKFAKVPHD